MADFAAVLAELASLKKQVGQLQYQLKVSQECTAMALDAMDSTTRQQFRADHGIGKNSRPTTPHPTNAPGRWKRNAVVRKGIPRTTDGWQTKQHKAPPAPAPNIADKLVQDGWAVPVLAHTDQLEVDKPGVLLTTTELGRKLMQGVKPSASIALLTPKPLAASDVETVVLVIDGAGKEDLRRRFVHQLGPMPVALAVQAHAGKKVVPDSVKLVLQYSKRYSGTNFDEKAPQAAARKMLEK